MTNHHFDIQKSFENQEEFLDLLKDNQLRDHATLRQISQHVTSQPSLFTGVGTIFLDYLINSIPDRDNLIKLNCINTYYLPYLANFPNKAQETRLKIFRYCLKIRNSKQELYDIELYHVLYSVLDQTAPSTVESWQNELDALPNNKQKLLQNFDDLIDDYLYNPSIYPEALSCRNLEAVDNVDVRLSLFNILYSSEMRPLRLANDRDFHFSKPWSSFLSQMNKSYQRRIFSIKLKLIEDDLWRLNTKALTLEKLDSSLNNTNWDFSSPQELEEVTRECILSLKSAHPRYISTIAYCLLNLLTVVSTMNDKKCTDRIKEMTQASWFEIYQTLLDDVVFEAGLFEDSASIQKLVKVSACYILLNTQLKDSSVEFPLSIWDHFYLQRSIFLKSVGIWEQDTSLNRLEKMIFTATGVPLPMEPKRKV